MHLDLDWAIHTSSTVQSMVQSELLLAIESTTYMIVHLYTITIECLCWNPETGVSFWAHEFLKCLKKTFDFIVQIEIWYLLFQYFCVNCTISVLSNVEILKLSACATKNQCSRSGSAGSVSFLGLPDPDPDPFINRQKIKKKPWLLQFFLLINKLFSLKTDVNGPSISISKKVKNKSYSICCWHLESHRRKDPDP
jgi:hypothetical protein